MSKILQIGVKILLLNKNRDQFLGITRNKNKCLEVAENIDIPGGRIECGEEPLEGLRRELMEEIGYKLTSEPILLDAANIVNHAKHQIVRMTYFSYENITLEDVNLGDEHEQKIFMNVAEHESFHPLLNQAIQKYEINFRRMVS